MKMYTELIVKNGIRDHKVFFQNGFYNSVALPTPMHRHNYAEIHLVADKAATFFINGDEVCAEDGNLILIPSNTLHALAGINEGECHVAFQIDCDVDRVISRHVSLPLVREFTDEIARCQVTRDYTRISAYIALFCACLQIDEQVAVSPITDYGFLICEFFSKHYNEELHLSDLARELHLSERQTERLVIKYTGRAFSQELSARRVEMAEYLADCTDMSLADIAQYVGYRSYSGLWKAQKKSKE